MCYRFLYSLSIICHPPHYCLVSHRSRDAREVQSSPLTVHGSIRQDYSLCDVVVLPLPDLLECLCCLCVCNSHLTLSNDDFIVYHLPFCFPACFIPRMNNMHICTVHDNIFLKIFTSIFTVYDDMYVYSYAYVCTNAQGGMQRPVFSHTG